MSLYDEVVKEPYEKDGCLWYEANFRSLSQMQVFLQENPDINRKIWKRLDLIASKNGDYSFAGEPLDKAIGYLTSGYDEDYDQFLGLRKDLMQALDIQKPRRNVIKSQVGTRVHMANYVANKPKCMLRLEPASTNKFVTIHFTISYTCMTSKAQIRNRGILTLNLIKILEMNGYTVRLNAFELDREDDEYMYMKVNLKNPNEILDEKKCYFPFCGPEFLRRISFRILESLPVRDPGWACSYGRALNVSEVREVLKLPKNDIVIGPPRNMSISGDDLYEDANRFFQRINLDESIKIKQLTRNPRRER